MKLKIGTKINAAIILVALVESAVWLLGDFAWHLGAPVLCSLSLLCFIAAVLYGFFVSRSIRKSIGRLAGCAQKLSLGDTDIHLEAGAKGEIGDLAAALEKIAEYVRGHAEAAERIAAGDAAFRIEIRSDSDNMSKSMQKLVTTVHALRTETDKLIQATKEGKLDARGDTAAFTGGWGTLVGGINEMIDAFVGPINVTAEYVDRISKGDIPPKITDAYRGDFNEIKNNLNGCIDAMNGLLAETDKLIQATKEGKLDARGDTAAFTGGWGTLVGGINEMIDAFVGPINVTAEYVDRISKGDIPPKITDAYRGDFNEIKNNLNGCIDAMNGLLAETDKLIRATKEGKLDARGDTAAFTGGWGTLVGGINEMIDAFVGPINVTAEYVDRISKGDIPPKITDAYRGDFNEIKNNLNGCIDAMNGLLAETDKLIRATKEGKLDARGDTAAFTGGWGTLVGGINEMIDAFVGPINEISSVMKAVSNGSLHTEVVGNYQGDFAQFKESINTTVTSINTVVKEISSVIVGIAGGNLNFETIHSYQGDWAEISSSLNKILDSMNKAMGDIDRAADQVASGSLQVAEGSESMAQGATEQAGAIEQLEAAVSTISKQTGVNASNAEKANEMADRAKETATVGNEQMKAMLSSMAEINEASNNISKIIKVIDDIASQTNMLSLNAAVEAARAGQQGKGFAVVAAEVRNLAVKSSNAVKETSDMIENSIKKVEAGMNIAHTTADALAKIVTEIGNSANLVKEIAAASNQQATSISEVSASIGQVSQVVQSTSATTEQSAALSKDLSGQAEKLKDTVSSFALRSTGGEPRSTALKSKPKY